ncbi:MAG: potassium transporter TrkG, partial [Bacteroidia bacterium]
AAIIFFGSLGFPAIQDLFGFKSLRNRMRYPWKDWTLATKISLYTSGVLVIVGAILFYLLEQNNTLTGVSTFGQVTHSIFQSVTTRTAGFNTVNFGELAAPTLIMMVLFMFIGASSASTGGGIKTSTFIVIFLSAFATIRNRKQIEINGRTLSTELLNRALTIFLFAASYIFIASFILSITEPNESPLNLLFETVSAFCTVGISTGITSDLSTFGKVILMISMYLGRVGILTLVVALSSATKTKNYTYPNAHLMIG